MDQVIEVSTREAQIEGVVQLFEDRLTSPKPEAGSWAELSRMLQGAPPWRKELSSRWAGREDWKAFLAWEKERQAVMEKKVRVHVGHWLAFVEMLDDGRMLVDWVRAGGGLLRGTVTLLRWGRWFWSDEYNHSEEHQGVSPAALNAVCAAAWIWLQRKAREKKILVQFNDNRAWVEPVEYLNDETAIVEWDQPGVGKVRGAAMRERKMETDNAGSFHVWAWGGDYEPVEF